MTRSEYVGLMAALIGLIFGAALLMALATETPKPEVTQTSSNTWHVYDPDNDPHRYINRTCATQSREVAQISTPGESYSRLNIVCK